MGVSTVFKASITGERNNLAQLFGFALLVGVAEAVGDAEFSMN